MRPGKAGGPEELGGLGDDRCVSSWAWGPGVFSKGEPGPVIPAIPSKSCIKNFIGTFVSGGYGKINVWNDLSIMITT